MGVRDSALATVRRPREREDRQPEFLAFAKVGGGWFKLGAAWRSTFRNGSEGYSVQFSTLPIGNWDGKFILALPDNGEPDDAQE